MWFKLSQFILRTRIPILIAITGITVLLGYFAVTNIKMDNTFGTMLPKDSDAKRDYIKLKELFGNNESLMFFAIDNSNLYELQKFNAWYELGEELKAHPAIDSVFSEAHIYQLEKNADEKKFFFEKVFKHKPQSQAELDSTKQVIKANPFYKGLIFNDETKASLMMIFVNETYMADLKKAKVILELEKDIKKYEEILGTIHISGLPHIRLTIGEKLQAELRLFIGLSIGVTSLLLFIFFRSLKIVLICNIVVFVGVIWSLGSIGFFDFRLSILMVLIPPLIIVISIPNSIFLINKFHQEIKDHGNKAKALSRVIQKIGNATFLTNLTTALGFATFMFTNSERLSEFGMIASLNILVVFLLSITILPIVLSYSAIPKSKHLKHLEKKWLHIAVEKLEFIALYKRKQVFIGSFIVIILAIIGGAQMHATGKITGDLPQGDQINKDLAFIESKFGGSLPFDMLIDTKKKNAFIHRFHEIENVQNYLAKYDQFSKSLSVTDGIKIINMAYSGNNPKKYTIPSLSKMRKFEPYLQNDEAGINPFVDTTGTITRISIQIKDLGAYKIQEVIDSVKDSVLFYLNPNQAFLDSAYQTAITLDGEEKNEFLQNFYFENINIYDNLVDMYAANDEALKDEFLFDELKINEYHNQASFNDSLQKAIDVENWEVTYTGTSVVASNGTRYMIFNLFTSLAIAVVLIGLIMALLFRSFRMVIISLIPNFIPLLFTAAVMGYFAIPVKPSTILVFSIAFGISVDDTIHFLAKFRQELKLHGHDFRRCILVALRETGVSMIYTSIVLFFGFLVFAFSEFGGTQALGILVSLTLLVAMFSNLLVLPALLFYMQKKMSNKALAEPLFQLYDEEVDIDFERLEINEGLKKYEVEDLKHQKND
ncbi:MAG: efflux RND transporter permease subunit [Putridiphycobacter sp.]